MRQLRWGARILGEVCMTVGLLLFLFLAWQLWWTDVTANREQAVTIHALERTFGPAGGLQPRPADPLASLTKVAFGQAFAIMRIPRFGAGYARPVLQGTDHDTLTNGIGHYQGTAFPGQVGNFAVAGHRTTYGKPFSDIDLLQKGDVIVVETKSIYFVYAVDRHAIVSPGQVEVIAPVPQDPGAHPSHSWLTMTACHPRYSANQRYIVFAKLVKRFLRTAGLPASFMSLPAGTVG